MSEATVAIEARAVGSVSRAWRRAPIGLWLLTSALVLTGLAMLLVTRDVALPPAWGFRGFPTVFASAMATIGTIIATRRPGHLVGWTLLIAGLLAAVLLFTTEYAIYGLLAYPGTLPSPELAAWVASWVWVVFLLLVGPVFLLYFPTGKLKSSRWRPLLWFAAAGTAGVVLLLAFFPGPIANLAFVDNPFGIEALRVVTPLGPLFVTVLGAALVGGAVSLGLRLREATGDERQQIKWVAYAGLFTGLAAIPGNFGKPFDVILIFAFTTVPIAAAVAILRYRLYDIDLLINRTLVYGSLTAILAGVYTASITLSTRLFQTATGERSDAAVVLTTLLVVALFTPLKSRLQAIVDRRFKEAREPAVRLARFVGTLGESPWILDPIRVRERFAEEARIAFGAAGAAILVDRETVPAFATLGWSGDGAASAQLGRMGGREVELHLGARERGRPYTAEEIAALQDAAAEIARLGD